MTNTEYLRKLAVRSNDGYLAGPALAAADKIDAQAERIKTLESAAMDCLVAEGQRCDAMTPQEAAKVLLTDMVKKQANYVSLLRAQPYGGFTGLRLSLTAISEDSQ